MVIILGGGTDSVEERATHSFRILWASLQFVFYDQYRQITSVWFISIISLITHISWPYKSAKKFNVVLDDGWWLCHGNYNKSKCMVTFRSRSKSIKGHWWVNDPRLHCEVVWVEWSLTSPFVTDKPAREHWYMSTPRTLWSRVIQPKCVANSEDVTLWDITGFRMCNWECQTIASNHTIHWLSHQSTLLCPSYTCSYIKMGDKMNPNST